MNLGFHGFLSPGVLGAPKRIFDSDLFRGAPIRKDYSQCTGQGPLLFIEIVKCVLFTLEDFDLLTKVVDSGVTCPWTSVTEIM